MARVIFRWRTFSEEQQETFSLRNGTIVLRKLSTNTLEFLLNDGLLSRHSVRNLITAEMVEKEKEVKENKQKGEES